MTPIDSLLAAKKALAASEAAELAKDYDGAWLEALQAGSWLEQWREALWDQKMQQRRERGLADTTEVMAEAYRSDNRDGDYPSLRLARAIVDKEFDNFI